MRKRRQNPQLSHAFLVTKNWSADNCIEPQHQSEKLGPVCSNRALFDFRPPEQALTLHHTV
jgi:hypothetical protein